MHSHLAKMIGQYILEIRAKSNVNQKDLAKKLKISAQFLGRIEKGEAPVPEALLKKCIAQLDMDEKKLIQIFRTAGKLEALSLLGKRSKKAKRKLA